jgi:uncharacterized membrane protein YhiD involved in acid resistance
MFLFFALAIGLACGEGLYSVALVGSLLIGVVTLAMARGFATARQEDFVVTIIRKADLGSEIDYDPILASFCKRFKIVSTQSSKVKKGSLTQLSFMANLKNDSRGEALVDALRQVEGVRQVTLAVQE